MLAEGNDPYWDDTDSNNKKWVFPGRPDLQEKANTRNADLDADVKKGKFEQASDIANDGVTINNIKKSDVGSFDNKQVTNATDVVDGLQSGENESSNEENNQDVNANNSSNEESKKNVNENTQSNESSDNSESDNNNNIGDDLDDLPF
jgi:hypothetical protein